MKSEKLTLDTNILIYAIDRQSKHKHQVAANLIKHIISNSLDCVLTLQSLSEFFYACIRKNILDPEIASEQVSDWQVLFPVVTANASVLTAAIKTVQKHRLSFWDALFFQTAKNAGVTTIFTEDMNHEQVIDHVKIVNPLVKSFELIG